MKCPGLARRLALSSRAVRCYRTAVGILVLVDAANRFSSLEWFYTDRGFAPRWVVLPDPEEGHVEWFLWAICPHAWRGSLIWAQCLSLVTAVSACGLACGYRPELCGVLCLWLRFSMTLRNVNTAFILDRYLQILLLLVVGLPSCQLAKRDAYLAHDFVLSPGAVVLAAQLLLIYYGAQGRMHTHAELVRIARHAHATLSTPASNAIPPACCLRGRRCWLEQSAP